MLRAALLLARQAKHSQRLCPGFQWAALNQGASVAACDALKSSENGCGYQRSFAAAAQPAQERVQVGLSPAYRGCWLALLKRGLSKPFQ